MLVRRRRAAAVLAAATTVLVLTACGSSSDSADAGATTGPAASDLAAPTTEQIEGEWSVFVVPQNPGASEQTVTFTASEVSTSDGCNDAVGGYTLGADGAFSVGELASTQKACETPSDTRHIDALKAATKVGLDPRSGFDQLVFTDANGALVLVLQDAAGA
jgi:heat shock protein HslJ